MPVTVGAAASAAEGILGIVQSISGGARTKKLLAQRQAYKTPEQIFKILQATEGQGGGDTATRDYLTGQADRSFSQILNASQLLGGDPNSFSSLFEQKFNAGLKIGNEFHKSNLEWFDKLFSAYNLVAENLAAEQKSKQDILKDKLQSASLDKQAGLQNIAGGINTGIAAFSADKTMDLYKQIQELQTQLNNTKKDTTDYSHGGFGS